MKITKSQLREIIREEIQQLNESDLTAYAIATIGGVIAPWIGIGIGVSIAYLRDEYGSVSKGLVSVAKNMWTDYKDDKKLKQILLKLKGDEDLKPFLKDPNKKGIRKVLATKLSEDEMKYLNKITRNHLNQIKEN
jgi:hypothetical protein